MMRLLVLAGQLPDEFESMDIACREVTSLSCWFGTERSI
jgi:hypothetical protein